MVFKEPESKSEDEIVEEKKEEEIPVPVPDRLETIVAIDKDSSGSEYNDSDAQSGILAEQSADFPKKNIGEIFSTNFFIVFV